MPYDAGMNRIAARRPGPNETTSDYQRRMIDRIEGEDCLAVAAGQLYWLCELASHLAPMVVDTIHRPHRWTIRQVFAHGIDVERIFGARMTHAAAGDATVLAGFDQDAYADAKFGSGNFSNLTTEWGHLRQSNLLLLQRLSPVCWDRTATIDGETMTVRAMAWFLAGHTQHHLQIVERRAGVSVDRLPPVQPPVIT